MLKKITAVALCVILARTLFVPISASYQSVDMNGGLTSRDLFFILWLVLV